MIRKARMSDVKGIHQLIAEYARKGDMLPRSLADIYENLRDYFVFEEDDGELVGSAAIHIMWEDLAEVRSLAVREGKMRRGVGPRLAGSCTSKPESFERIGLHTVDKADLPQKIWTDCLKCSKFPDCDEVALVADFSGRRRG